MDGLAFLDVHYDGDAARCACVVATDWTAEVPKLEFTVDRLGVAPYVSGAFFEREFPSLIAAIDELQHRGVDASCLVVDGYVLLDADERPGLGWHLWQHYGGRYAVVGIAKTAFSGNTAAIPVTHGGSIRPLFVTAIGVDPAEIAEAVKRMPGPHRLPTLVARADRLSRSAG